MWKSMSDRITQHSDTVAIIYFLIPNLIFDTFTLIIIIIITTAQEWLLATFYNTVQNDPHYLLAEISDMHVFAEKTGSLQQTFT